MRPETSLPMNLCDSHVCSVCKHRAGAVAGQHPLHRLARQGCFQQGGQGRPGAADGAAGSNQPLLHLLAAVHPICCRHSCGPQCHLSPIILFL